MGCGWVAQAMWWVAQAMWWFHENNATLWLHLASLSLPNFQLSWKSKMEPSVAKKFKTQNDGCPGEPRWVCEHLERGVHGVAEGAHQGWEELHC